MKLYTMPGTCALAPNIISLWVGVDLDVINLKRGDHQKPAYLAVNPRGQVPALVLDDGTVLTEALAIMSFLKQIGSRNGATQATSQLSNARELEALSFMTSEVHADFGGHFAPQRTARTDAAQDEVRAFTYKRLHDHFLRLDAQVQSGGTGWYLAERSIADAYLFVLVRWIDLTPLDAAQYPALAAFRSRMENDPDVITAMQRQGMATTSKALH